MPDRLRIDAVYRHVRDGSPGQGVGYGVEPPGVRHHPARLGKYVAIEEEEDVVGRRLGTTVPRPGQPEPAALLAHHFDVQRRRGEALQRRLRPVVHDDHLEQLPRIGLAFERRQGSRQRLGRRLVGRDDHANRQGGRERLQRLYFNLMPIVVLNRCGFWAQGSLAFAYFRYRLGRRVQRLPANESFINL